MSESNNLSGKFRRGPAADTNNTDAKNSVYVDSSKIKELQERHRILHERRLRRQIEREAAQKELESCIAEAKNLFGVSDIESLEKLALEHEQKESEAIAKYSEELDEEERILNGIDAALAELSNEPN